MTPTQLTHFRALMRLIAPHLFVPELHQVAVVACRADWGALLGSVDVAIEAERSPFFKRQLAAWRDRALEIAPLGRAA